MVALCVGHQLEAAAVPTKADYAKLSFCQSSLNFPWHVCTWQHGRRGSICPKIVQEEQYKDSRETSCQGAPECLDLDLHANSSKLQCFASYLETGSPSKRHSSTDALDIRESSILQ